MSIENALDIGPNICLNSLDFASKVHELFMCRIRAFQQSRSQLQADKKIDVENLKILLGELEELNTYLRGVHSQLDDIDSRLLRVLADM